MTSPQWRQMTAATIRDAAARYATHVPDKLRSLDKARLETIPAAIQQRKGSDKKGAYLEKGELATLVEWKLKHGTFRPKLLQLATSNAADTIISTTRDAFASYDASKASSSESSAAPPTAALTTLTKALSGIGPATASLILSSYDPANAPFFSDELYQLAFGKGQKIKYNLKEFEALWTAVADLKARLGQNVTALELEKAAWALAREQGNASVETAAAGAKTPSVGVDAQPPPHRARKRGATHPEPNVEAPRSSKRRL